MIRAVLLDLDNTLLENEMQTFWIADRKAPHPAGEPPPDGQGELADFARWMLRRQEGLQIT